jgi:hypothetical protein
MDFLLASDGDAVEEIILEGVGILSAKISPLHKRAVGKVLKFMSSFRPKLVITEAGPKLELLPGKSPKQSIKDALMALDKLAGLENRQCVMVMDEFQQIAAIKDNIVLEAAIRHAVERAENITYIFSGSHRNLLLEMFDRQERPLYRLCYLITLNRIKAKDYILFVKTAFKKKWKKIIADSSILKILELTQRHPYYLNLLCSKLCADKAMPTAHKIESVWKVVIEEEWPRVANELLSLSPNQRAVLLFIAKEPTSQPSSHEFLQKTRLSGASMKQSLEVLLAKDLVYKDDAGFFRPLNPIITYVFRQ